MTTWKRRGVFGILLGLALVLGLCPMVGIADEVMTPEGDGEAAFDVRGRTTTTSPA